jgi:hypothetical protein
VENAFSAGHYYAGTTITGQCCLATRSRVLCRLVACPKLGDTPQQSPQHAHITIAAPAAKLGQLPLCAGTTAIACSGEFILLWFAGWLSECTASHSAQHNSVVQCILTTKYAFPYCVVCSLTTNLQSTIHCNNANFVLWFAFSYCVVCSLQPDNQHNTMGDMDLCQLA